MTRTPLMVMTGEFWRGSTGLGLADGFRAMGWAVQEIDIGRYYPALGNSFADKAIRRSIATRSLRAFRAAILEACDALKPDVFLTIKGTAITAQMLDRIRVAAQTTAVFYPDVHFGHPDLDLETLGRFDRLITTKTFQLAHLCERFGADRIAYVPHGFASSVHRPLHTPMDETAYQADLQHVGTCSPSKLHWMSYLQTAIPEATLRLIGAGWARATEGTNLTSSVVASSLVNCAYTDALQTARINVAVLFGANDGGWQDNVSTRSFEIPACGGFMLHVDNDEVREFFTPGHEIDVFSTPDELADKARFYLDRPELRATMISRAYQRCMPAYSYDTRAREILAIIRS
jgi:spore maturation protein CgeB